MKSKLAISILCASLLASCALPEPTVVPRGDGEYEVVSQGYSESESLNAALEKANKTCYTTYTKPAVSYQYTWQDETYHRNTKMTTSIFHTRMWFKCK